MQNLFGIPYQDPRVQRPSQQQLIGQPMYAPTPLHTTTGVAPMQGLERPMVDPVDIATFNAVTGPAKNFAARSLGDLFATTAIGAQAGDGSDLATMLYGFHPRSLYKAIQQSGQLVGRSFGGDDLIQFQVDPKRTMRDAPLFGEGSGSVFQTKDLDLSKFKLARASDKLTAAQSRDLYDYFNVNIKEGTPLQRVLDTIPFTDERSTRSGIMRVLRLDGIKDEAGGIAFRPDVKIPLSGKRKEVNANSLGSLFSDNAK